MKVETHNHPTAISPFPGAATGSGGEIRDEGATGRGAKPKAGLVGFTRRDLHMPGCRAPWERSARQARADRVARSRSCSRGRSAAPPSTTSSGGRTCSATSAASSSSPPSASELRGYHKPIMIAGGLGNIRAEHVQKSELPVGAKLVVLGGPAMRIGLGGGAASSLGAGASSEELDFASVQRDNAEMERRCQEVIDRCWALGDENPIASIHDVGAGGLSNALPELVHESGRGAALDLRAVPNDEPGMSPLEIWCNEAQERYVLGLSPRAARAFRGALRARALPVRGGRRRDRGRRLELHDQHFGNAPIDMPLEVLLGKPPQMLRDVKSVLPSREPFDLGAGRPRGGGRARAAPADGRGQDVPRSRSATAPSAGSCVRDPMVGPLQVPVADCAVTAVGFDGYAGEAMAMGERTPIALLDAAASARMAVGEAITNLAAAQHRRPLAT